MKTFLIHWMCYLHGDITDQLYLTQMNSWRFWFSIFSLLRSCRHFWDGPASDLAPSNQICKVQQIVYQGRMKREHIVILLLLLMLLFLLLFCRKTLWWHTGGFGLSLSLLLLLLLLIWLFFSLLIGFLHIIKKNFHKFFNNFSWFYW